MAQDEPWILVVADDAGLRGRIRALMPLSRPVLYAATVEGARDMLRCNPVAAVVGDASLLAAVRRSIGPEVRTVAVPTGGKTRVDLSAAAAGAASVGADLRRAVESALGSAASGGPPTPAGERLVGTSSVMNRVFERIRQVAQSDGNVLIEGETGTGKDLAARAIHDASPRSQGPFVEYDCAASFSDLMESNLFGHCRGAFTSAHRNRRGALEAADGGTLFLDDIDSLDPFRQPMLLRILQDKKFQRLGSDRVIRVDVRFIAATNQNLAEMLDSGLLRRDLYYRLNILPIHMPPLRERESDVAVLTDYFSARWSRRTGHRAKPLSAGARRLLAAYPWPGNVRELRNAVERLQTLCQQPTIDAKAVSEVLASDPAETPVAPMYRERRSFERQLIYRALNESGGNRTRAAALLGIHRNTLLAKIKAADADKTH